jgi:hypothetical protein
MWADGDDFMAEAANMDDVDPHAARVDAADPNAVQDQAAANAVHAEAAANAEAANLDDADPNAAEDQAAPDAVQDLAAANAVHVEAAPNAEAANLDDADPNAAQDQAAPIAGRVQAAPDVPDLNVLVYGIANAVHALLVQGPHGQIAAIDQVPMDQAQPQNDDGQVAAQDQVAHGEDQPAQDPGGVATGANQNPVGPREFNRHDLLEMYPGLAQQLLSIMEDVKEMRALTIDNARMISKKHLVFQGARIPPQKPGEDVTVVFIDFIAKEVGVWIRPDDIGQVHRLGNGFIAEFLNRKCGSPFRRLLRVKPGLDLQIEIRLITEDKKILDQARQMLHSGLISSFYVDPVSGKVTVVLGNGRIMSISDEKKIIELKLQLENCHNY